MLRIHPKLIFTAAAVLMGTLGFLVYIPGLPGDFIFDDITSISGNPGILITHLGLAELTRAVLSAPVGGLLRPLSMLSFILDAHFFGLAPGAFKLTNILLHLACGAVLWCVAREILRAYAPRMRPTPSASGIAWLSLAATGIWLVHPLNLTAVLYVVQRETVLSALFTAAAIWAYLAGRRRQRDCGQGLVLIWVATPLLTLLGLLCKENAALTPLYLLVIEFTLLRFQVRNGVKSRPIRWFYAVFLAAPMVAGGALMAMRPDFFLAAYVNRGFTMHERLLSECRILMDYLRWTLLPDLHELALFHDDIAPSRGLLQPPTTLLCVLALAALLAAAVSLRRRAPLLSLGILWFFVGHLLESTFLPLELTFEHRNYLPIFGPILACVGTLYPAAERHGSARLAKALALASVLLFATVTGIRSLEWHDELSFARSEAAHHPDSPRAQYELAWAYMTIILTTRDTSLVPRAVEAALHSKALDHGINQDIGLAYLFSELGDRNQAHVYLETAAAGVKSAAPSSTLQLALLSLLVMAKPENQPLFTSMDSILRNSTGNARLLKNDCYMGNIWNTYGLFQQKTGDFLDAMASMHKAVSLCPRQAQIRANFALMLLTYADTRDARAQIDALRALHDVRYSSNLYALEQEWARQVALKTKP